MILDASHKRWIFATMALAAAAAGLYVLQAWLLYPVAPSGGSVAGLWFGIAGTTLLAFAGLLPVRKWYPLARIGSAQTWLRAHIWLSLLGSLLILFHAAFRWRGTIEQVLMLLLAGLVVSGIWGLVVQHLLTRQLSLQVPLETFYENLPQVCRVLQFEGDVLLTTLCESPLPLEADREIATDERLKNRGVLGRDYLARLAKVYAASGAIGPSNESPADEPVRPVEVKAAAAAAPMKETSAPPDETIAASPAKMSAAEKIALMRTKKAAVGPAAETATSAKPEATATAAKELSTAEKLKLMRAKKPAAADGATVAVATAEAATPIAAVATEAPAEGAAPLSTKDKLAMMRAGKKPAAAPATPTTSAAPPPAEPKTVPAPPQPAAARTIKPEALKPFCEGLRAFYLERVRPFLAWERDGAAAGMETEAASTVVFARMKAALPAELHGPLEQLAALCDARRQFATQARIYHWLHGWLVFVHIPAAAALLTLIVVHVAASLYW